METKTEKNKGKTITNICCLGVDYVGIPLCTVIASACPALKIAVADMDPSRITSWTTRQIPSQEPELEELLKKCQNKNLLFTGDTENAIKAADLIFISANTPMKSQGCGENKIPDVADVEAAARLIAKIATTPKIIVEKSSVPMGTNDVLKRILRENKNEKVKFLILSNPEFFSAGTAIKHLLNPSRVLIGSDQTMEALSAAESLASIYAQWVPREKIITMKTWSAELSKLSVNAFLAQRLTSVNAMSVLCEVTGADVEEVVRIMKGFSVIGPEYLEPSLGFGGAHLKKDLTCLIYMCERLHLIEVADYWRQVIELNEFRKDTFKKKILNVFFNTMTHKKIAVWGFSYKKDIDLTTDSPALYICKHLLEEGAKLNVYDPMVEKRQIIEEIQKAVKGKDPEKEINVCEDPYKAAFKCHAVVCCTDWDEFKTLDFGTVYRDMMRPAYVFDGRNCLPHNELCSLGFKVIAVGKNSKKS